ncbi:MAG: sorbosone dehydrogenase family protein [Alphaproteobacteria bacterium]|nr:sorbosone dehydrogenase family protein [Alphaproteobacteria bacterium]MBV9376182.1 sorbosone dehydrogenase family protein [Alphaproteobacteria bacterium]
MGILSKAMAGATAGLLAAATAATLAQSPPVLTGATAYGDWQTDGPGVRRKITPLDMPRPYETASASRHPTVVARPAEAWPKAPPGFVVELFASGLDNPRAIRTAPNGDVFVAESEPGRVLVLRGAGSAKAPETRTFAENLYQPFGIAFWPPGPDPAYVYIANTDTVVRFPYRPGDRPGDRGPTGPAETIVSGLPRGGHWTRDIAFSPDGSRMFVSVGSRSNAADRWINAPWQSDEGRALVLSFTPEGKDKRVFATGLRNCVGMAVQPATGELWCSVNERDGLGDDLPPDFLTRVREGGFYGWPWFYIGTHEDPRHTGEQPALRSRVTVPDVLVQPHSAAMEMTFYNGTQFPAEYRGDMFAAFHGSWNRTKRTGYKVVRILMKNGQPAGEYEDFLTGFVINDRNVWARPVGVAVAQDGSLLVSEDGNGTIWRVSYRGP